MKDITSNEMKIVLLILKSPETEYNANSLAKAIGISAMGALKIVKRLEKENLLVAEKKGRGVFYRLNLSNDYAKQYLKFLVQRETTYSHPYVKRWINELKKISKASIIILFGSVISKNEQAKDIDVLFVTNKKSFGSLKKEIEKNNLLNTKKIHPLFQTKEDLKENIKERNKIVLNAIKGKIILGMDGFLRAISI